MHSRNNNSVTRKTEFSLIGLNTSPIIIASAGTRLVNKLFTNSFKESRLSTRFFALAAFLVQSDFTDLIPTKSSASNRLNACSSDRQHHLLVITTCYGRSSSLISSHKQ